MPQQVSRLLLAFALAAAAFVAARTYLVPESFGEVGHYRLAAVDSIVAHEMKYAGQQRCTGCHRALNERRLAGNHAGVACEVCHGPSVDHASGPREVQPSAPRDRAFCPLCHSYNAARPTGFPQIDPVAHNPLTPCMECHDPHQPEPPETPEECSACHGQIARQKAVSHHATLPCTTCHEAPDEHKLSPREVTPTKPAERTFCGQCHAEDASSPARIPRIDLRRHNPRYVCWQCHYPHYPETGEP